MRGWLWITAQSWWIIPDSHHTHKQFKLWGLINVVATHSHTKTPHRVPASRETRANNSNTAASQIKCASQLVLWRLETRRLEKETRGMNLAGSLMAHPCSFLSFPPPVSFSFLYISHSFAQPRRPRGRLRVLFHSTPQRHKGGGGLLSEPRGEKPRGLPVRAAGGGLEEGA